MSIVRFRRRSWVLLFYRNIPPKGWNIPTGASHYEDEWDDVSELANREFTEEVLLIKENLESGSTHCTLIALGIPTNNPHWQEKAYEFTDKAIELRGKEGLGIARPTDEPPRAPKPGAIERAGGRADVEQVAAYFVRANHKMAQTSYVFSLNMPEHGIETIKVFKFDMDKAGANYILDGEVAEGGSKLVKAPVMLLSLDYLKSNIDAMRRTEPVMHLKDSQECKPLPKVPRGRRASPNGDYQDCDFVLFDYDIPHADEPIKTKFSQIAREEKITEVEYQYLCAVTWKTLEICLSHNIV